MSPLHKHKLVSRARTTGAFLTLQLNSRFYFVGCAELLKACAGRVLEPGRSTNTVRVVGIPMKQREFLLSNVNEDGPYRGHPTSAAAFTTQLSMHGGVDLISATVCAFNATETANKKRMTRVKTMSG